MTLLHVPAPNSKPSGPKPRSTSVSAEEGAMTFTRSIRCALSSRRRFIPVLGAPVLSAMILVIAATASTAGHTFGNASPRLTTAEHLFSRHEPSDRSASSLSGTPGAVSCAVLDSIGNPVTQVAAMSFGDPGYWLQFRSSGTLAKKVRFAVMPLFAGSPAREQVQRFDTDFSSVVTTTFCV